jgi:hypothetical protein
MAPNPVMTAKSGMGTKRARNEMSLEMQLRLGFDECNYSSAEPNPISCRI